MAVFSSIIGAIGASTAAAAGAAISAVGTIAGVVGQVQQASGQRKALAAQKRAEAIRQSEMELTSKRNSLELIRQQQVARATSLSNITAAGGDASGGSALGGAEGTISGQYGRGIDREQDNLAFGQGIFQANRDALRGQQQAARGGTIASAGTGLTSLGNAFVNNAERIGRIGGRS